MRLLDRYLLREFVGYLVLSLLGCFVIFLVVDLVEKIDVFLDHHASAGLMAQYFLNLAPEAVDKMMPVALLLATFLSLGQLNKFGELTAMRASGLSLVRILMPVFAVSWMCVGLLFLMGEYIKPAAAKARDEIYNRRIQHLADNTNTERADITYLGQGGRIWYMRLYVVPEERMHEVSLQEFKNGRLTRRTDAAEASWDGSHWVFASGYQRSFDHGRETATAFDRIRVGNLAERPEDFAKKDPQPEEMNFGQLKDYVQRLRSSGARVNNYLVDLQLKLAFPVICFVVVMIGGALATRLRMQSAALGFGLSVAIAFLYYGFMRAGQALGHNGALNPYFAAWLGDIVFGGAGLWMMVQAQRS